MDYLATDVIDRVSSTLQRTLDGAAPCLNRAAIELGAREVAVMLASGRRVEITYFWSSSNRALPEEHLSAQQQDHLKAVASTSGPVEGATPLGQILGRTISPDSRSFLLFPWQIRQQTVTVIFGFAATKAPSGSVPAAILDSLDLVRLATWSVKEIARLCAELRAMNDKLAGLKLVESAKRVLQAEHGLSEEEAYHHIRGLSRRRRIRLAVLAQEILRTRGQKKLSAARTGT
jgi:hypothetical protein